MNSSLRRSGTDMPFSVKRFQTSRRMLEPTLAVPFSGSMIQKRISRTMHSSVKSLTRQTGCGQLITRSVALAAAMTMAIASSRSDV